jgi:predicted 3-demethylubiquinone-9 3-methyltransferase (glyoxalase superfamily)
MATLQKIVPNLWFDQNAEQAAKFYISIFKNASIDKTSHYGPEGYDIHKMPEGTVMTVEFTLEGQRFLGLNGGPIFKFNEAVSFLVYCDSQAEIDHYWEKLGEGGDPSAQQCGWLKDKFGLSWQVSPTVLDKMLRDPDREKAGRVMNAMLGMKKINIADLERAYAG